MKYYLLRNPKVHGYLTVRPNDLKTHYMCFDNLNTARKCKEFVRTHRKKYGKWPSLDFSLSNEQLQYDNSTGYADNVNIITQNIQEIEYIMKYTNMPILLCMDFTVIPYNNTFTVSFNAQELEAPLDHSLYIRNLERCISDS